MTITTNRRGFLKSSVAGASAAATMVAAPAIVRAQQVTPVAMPVDVERGRAHLQGLPGSLRADQGQHQRPAGDRAVRGRRGHRRVRDPRCGQRRRAAGALVVARLLHRQGCRPRRHQRFRVRLPASAAGRGLVPASRRPADAARGLRQVQRLSGRRELVGRGVDRLQEADPDDGGLQGRQVPLAARHDGGDPDQARRLDRRAAGRRGVLGARQGRGRCGRLGDHLDERAHGLPRRRQVSRPRSSTRCRCRNSPSISRPGRPCPTTSRASCSPARASGPGTRCSASPSTTCAC